MPTTSIRIDHELEQRLQKLAKLTGRPKTWYIRHALEIYLMQEEWLTEAIQQGVNEADAGQFAADEDVRAAFAKWNVDIES